MPRRSTRQKDSAAVERASRGRATGRAVVRREQWLTGFCGQSRIHSLCPAEIRNGRKARQPVVLCTCDCHGDLGRRRTALRERLREGTA